MYARMNASTAYARPGSHTRGMLRSTGWLCLVVGLAGFVAGCSSSSSGEPPTTTAASHSQPPATVRAVTRVTIGACPTLAPNGFPTNYNVHVAGLGRALVPIAATSVRVCQYSQGDNSLEVSALVTGATAQRLRSQAGALARWPTSTSAGVCAVGQVWFIRFGSATANVDVLTSQAVPSDCSEAYNGTLFVRATSAWFTALRTIATAPKAKGATP
jgi:hypothetical protein